VVKWFSEILIYFKMQW